MVKRTALAIAMCAVMVLVAAVPVIADSHYIEKLEKGPNNSAVTWSYTPTGYGIWSGHVVNTGLRSIVVDVDDNTNGMMVNILHQRIRFAAFDQYPAGELDTQGALMAAGRIYSITITPNGPRGSSCTVADMFDEAVPPVAVIEATMTYLSVAVDGSASNDPDLGTIDSYTWAFGDGGSATGPTATHTYGAAGDFLITLTVVDNEGLEGTASQMVTAVMPPPPVAEFTATVSGLTVAVDASASSAVAGIASYTWSWGDGSAPEVMTTPLASHTYVPTLTLSMPRISLSAPGTESLIAAAPPPPYACFGYVKDGVGNPVFEAAVTITDLNTGTVWTTTTDAAYGYYMVDLNMYYETGVGWNTGDTIEVSAAKGGATGTAQGIAMGPGNEAFLWLDITVSGGEPTAHDMPITLTVTDMLGQSTSATKIVTLWW